MALPSGIKCCFFGFFFPFGSPQACANTHGFVSHWCPILCTNGHRRIKRRANHQTPKCRGTMATHARLTLPQPRAWQRCSPAATQSTVAGLNIPRARGEGQKSQETTAGCTPERSGASPGSEGPAPSTVQREQLGKSSQGNNRPASISSGSWGNSVGL